MTPHMLLALTWQLPAAFTAVPLVHRLLPFKLSSRALPLFYFLVTWLCMALPDSACLALGAAGLLSMIQIRLGENLANSPGPDMAEVANRIALAWDYIVTHLPQLPVKGKQVHSIHDAVEDDNPDDEESEDEQTAYQEPPQDARATVVSRIPHLD